MLSSGQPQGGVAQLPAGSGLLGRLRRWPELTMRAAQAADKADARSRSKEGRDKGVSGPPSPPSGSRGGLEFRSVVPPAVPESRVAPGADGLSGPHDDRVQRRAIRGGPVDLSRESAELRELRAFEQDSFPRAGLREQLGQASEGREPTLLVPSQRAGSSSFASTGLGPDSVPEGLHSPLDRREGEPAPSPSIPWLSALRLLDNLGLSPTFVRFEAHVIKYLEFYKEEKRGRAIIGSWLRRQGRYKALIEQTLDRYNLPRFLLYVSMIESGYDPHDKSNKGAVGLWQFLPEGARIYGLRVDYWVDERKDPVRATEAASRYLGDLKARFGSWHLALAAFNAGYGAVLRAMQKYNTNDYWELCRHEDGLPWETLLYVPKAIATALVGENKSFFGFEDTVSDPPIVFDSVPLRGSVSLATAARVVGSTLEELQRLNPHLRRSRTPPLSSGESFELRLPAGTAAQFQASSDSKGEKLEAHIVRFGERLEEIAKARGTSVSTLKRINGVDDTTEIRAGITLLVPPVSSRAEQAAPSATTPLSAEELVLVAVPDKRLTVPGKKRIFYRVISGDSIWTIARYFKVKEADLLRWNNLDPEATLATKMVLDLWVDPDFDTSQVVLVDPARVRVVTTGSDEFFELVETLRGRRRIQHKCQPGDTLEKIGKRYGLTVADVERINRLGRQSELKPGQVIVVYQNLSSSERAEALSKLLGGEAVSDDKSGKKGDKKADSDAKKDGDSDSDSDSKKAAEPDSESKDGGDAGSEAHPPVTGKAAHEHKSEEPSGPESEAKTDDEKPERARGSGKRRSLPAPPEAPASERE